MVNGEKQAARISAVQQKNIRSLFRGNILSEVHWTRVLERTEREIVGIIHRTCHPEGIVMRA
jgi:hypothetical protein